MSWLYKDGVGTLWKVFVSLGALTLDNFSVQQLSKTLFWPWRRDIVKPASPTLQTLFQAWTLNLMSRLIGFFIRLSTIFVGLILFLLESIFALLSLIFALSLPISLPLLYILAFIWLTDAVFFLPGIILLMAAVIITITVGRIYIFRGLKNPPLPFPLINALAKLHAAEKIDLEPFLDGEAKKIFLASQSLQDLKTELLESDKARFIFIRTSLARKEITQPTSDQIAEKEFLLKAGEFAVQERHQRIETGDLILALAHFDRLFQDQLTKNNLDASDLKKIIGWQTNFWKLLHPKNQLTEPQNLRFTGGVGKNWAAGFTPLLDQISLDLTEKVNTATYDYHYYGHRRTIDQMERILARSGQKNLILVGSEGSGKRTTVLGLARRVLLGKTLASLTHKKVLELDLTGVISRENPEELLVGIFSEAIRAGNIILFIEHLERLFSESRLMAVILPALQSSSLQIIGSTDPAGWQKMVNEQPILHDVFEIVNFVEPSEEETLAILMDICPYFEQTNNVLFTYPALKEVYQTAKRYISSRSFPQKAIDLLDETATEASRRQSRIITPAVVDEIVSQKISAPVGQSQSQENEVLLNLENLLHQRVINQNKAIGAIANALRRSRSGVGNPDKPIGSFLFLGPTGVGKTETAKALAEVYFGAEKRMVRLDMSEFQTPESIRQIIGNPESGAGGRLTDAVKSAPYSLLLLDEIEKAHPNILNLFLQILDEGQVTDAFNQPVDFKNTIIIATSNAGANLIRQEINRQRQTLDMAVFTKGLLEYLQDRHIFRPEFLNRFDAAIVFQPLGEAELLAVVELLNEKINLNLQRQHYSFVLTAEAKKLLAVIGFDPKFGARALQRAMQDYVSNIVAEAILKKTISQNQPLTITAEMIKEKMV